MANRNAVEVWKYTLAPGNDIRKVDMPAGARVLTVAGQQDEVTMWVLVRPKAPREQRYFLVLETGHPFLDGGDLKYLGSALTKLGAYVTHVFEVVHEEEGA